MDKLDLYFVDKRDLCYVEIEIIQEGLIGREKHVFKNKRLKCKCGVEIEIKNNAAKRQHEKSQMHQTYLKVIKNKDENYVYKPNYKRALPYN